MSKLPSNLLDKNCNNRRESQRVLPEYIQPFLTSILGKPYTGQKQIFHAQPLDFLVGTVIELMTGGLFTYLGMSNLDSNLAWVLLIIVGWIFTTSGMRQGQVIIAHHAAHLNFTGNKNIDTFLGRLTTMILIIHEFDHYAQKHRIHHSVQRHQTFEDETIRFLLFLVELKIGVPKEENWNRLLRSFISPKFHGKFLLARIVSNFVSSPLSYKISVYSLWSIVLIIVGLTNNWSTLIVCWVVPSTVLYQIITILRLAAEHTLPDVQVYLNRNKKYICDSTVAVFLGDFVPNTSLEGWHKLCAWTIWWLRLFFIHAITRLMVLPGDTPVHDVHSRYPGTDDWANAIYLRERQLIEDKENKRWPSPYTEIYGLNAAIDHNLESFSNFPPELFDVDSSWIDVYGYGS